MEYIRRGCAYDGSGYTAEEQKWWTTFIAFDLSDNLLADTRRVAADVRLVVDKGAQSVFGEDLTLDLATDSLEDQELLAEGLAVWKRSKWQQIKGQVALWGAKFGRVGIEVVRTSPGKPHKSIFVVRSPTEYRVFHSAGATGEIARVVITIEWDDAPEVTPYGEYSTNPVRHKTVRILTKTDILVYLDGELIEDESGPHGLGVVPFINLRWLPAEEEEQGMWAASGPLESALALYDSALAKADAVMRRYADPKLKITGVDVGDDSEVLKFGKILELKDGDAAYLEPGLAGLAISLDIAREALVQARQAMPEFALVGAGANSSGEALIRRQADFTAKIKEIRGRWLPAIADATAYGALLDRDEEIDPDLDYFEVTAPPVSTPDVLQGLEALSRASTVLPLLTRDVLRHYKRLGLLSADVDIEEYEAEIAALSADPAPDPGGEDE